MGIIPLILFLIGKLVGKGPNEGKENAVIIILCRNSDLNDISGTLENFEARFNNKFGYPYVFLNDEEFTPEFKTRIKSIVSSKVDFGLVSNEHFGLPPWINMQKTNTYMSFLKNKGIIYAESLSYRKMCRFFSGFFYRHPLVLKYDYYWRIEPSVRFLCDINYDPFKFLRENKKEYGFVIAINEFMDTIATLYETTLDFVFKNRNLIGNPRINNFIFGENSTYNGCHFWSNFEIASFNFFRSPVYTKYFEHLDKAGGFFHERWGDAPVHTLAATFFLDKEKVHYFEDIGYEHPPFQHCPSFPSMRSQCSCDPKNSIDFNHNTCADAWKVGMSKFPNTL